MVNFKKMMFWRRDIEGLHIKLAGMKAKDEKIKEVLRNAVSAPTWMVNEYIANGEAIGRLEGRIAAMEEEKNG